METFHKVFRLILAVFWCLNQCSARNVELTNEVWHRFDKSIDWEVQNAVQTLNETVEKFSLFQNYSDNYESRDAAEYSRVGVFLFTRYCGPGARLLNRFFKTDERTYADIDFCCKMHDDCPDYVLQPADYNSYPGLDVRPQFFSRLKCSCDVDFYRCLQDINTIYAYSVGVGYGIFQRYCFEFEHPILGCTEYYSGFGLKRCMSYEIDYNAPKQWQWFDVLPPYLDIYSFPQFIQNAFSFD